MLTILNNQSHCTNFRALIPISEYKGTILKLTERDKELIKNYEKQIADYEAQSFAIDKQFSLKRLSYEKSNYLKNKDNGIGTSIKFLKEKIKQIKMNRLQEQKKNSGLDTTI